MNDHQIDGFPRFYIDFSLLMVASNVSSAPWHVGKSTIFDRGFSHSHVHLVRDFSQPAMVEDAVAKRLSKS